MTPDRKWEVGSGEGEGEGEGRDESAKERGMRETRRGGGGRGWGERVSLGRVEGPRGGEGWGGHVKQSRCSCDCGCSSVVVVVVVVGVVCHVSDESRLRFRFRVSFRSRSRFLPLPNDPSYPIEIRFGWGGVGLRGGCRVGEASRGRCGRRKGEGER